jgi:hypothetical protein
MYTDQKLNIIHLAHRTDRLETINNQLVNNKIRACMWPGIINPDPKVGIASAHKQIVAYAQKKKLPSIIIAEDDLKFTSSTSFNFFLTNEPLDYDLYLSGIYYGKIESDNSVKDFAGLTLYKINQKFYDTFLSIPDGMDLDRALAHKGKYIVCNPFVALQHNGFSDNQKEYCNYDQLLANRNLYK